MEQPAKSTNVMKWVLTVIFSIAIIAGVVSGISTLGGESSPQPQQQVQTQQNTFG
ncbi:hypothetical protein [Vibrio phage RYC]|nr:hypothetical protein [Vibrio phage RYC]